MLTTEKADLLHRTPKIISNSIVWSVLSGDRYRLDVKVLAPDLNEVLTLSCSINKTNFSFCLLYQGYPIRKFTKHALHISRTTGERFTQPHKHTWDEVSEDDLAFIPQDIDPASSIDDQLLAFLREENVNPIGGYQRLLLSGL